MDVTITPAEMKALEQDFMDEYGVPGALLMEHAAQGVVEALARRVPGGRVLFLCGPGNNGGDGWAAARLWQARGGRSVVWALPGSPRGDAAMNRALAVQAGLPVVTLDECPDALPACDAVVDALFGTGLSHDIDGTAASLIDLVNRSRVPVVAVDIPSGLDGTTGCVRGTAILAAETVTFHRPKPGLLLRDGASHTGQLTVQPILIPPEYGDIDGLRVLGPADRKHLIPPRAVDSHKGTFGRCVILAGSPGMAGAAAFCASACVKAGAGLTTILCRESLLPILQTLVPGAMCLPLPEKNGCLLPEAEEIAADALSIAASACIGPGLGQALDLLPLLRTFSEAECPVVWDADALNLLSDHDSLLPLPEHDVITPHPGEAGRLIGSSIPEILADPLAALDSLHDLCGCAVLLKGARTLVTDGITSFVNACASPALAKGGSGDVLAGILTALLARGDHATVEAAALAALIHGLAGIRAAELHGENCVTPQNLIDCIRLD